MDKKSLKRKFFRILTENLILKRAQLEIVLNIAKSNIGNSKLLYQRWSLKHLFIIGHENLFTSK